MTQAGICPPSATAWRVWFNKRITLPGGGAQPLRSPSRVYSISVTLCFIFGRKNHHSAALSAPLEVVLTVMQEAKKDYYGQFASEDFQQLRKKVHKQTTPIGCKEIHGPSLQNNGGLHYRDCGINSLDTTKGKIRTCRLWNHTFKDAHQDSKTQKLCIGLPEQESGKKPNHLTLWSWKFGQNRVSFISHHEIIFIFRLFAIFKADLLLYPLVKYGNQIKCQKSKTSCPWTPDSNVTQSCIWSDLLQSDRPRDWIFRACDCLLPWDMFVWSAVSLESTDIYGSRDCIRFRNFSNTSALADSWMPLFIGAFPC